MKEKRDVERCGSTAVEWARGRCSIDPPTFFAPELPDRDIVRAALPEELKIHHLKEHLPKFFSDALDIAKEKARCLYARCWVNKLVYTRDLVKRRAKLSLSPERITHYFKPSSNGTKRKALFTN